MGNVGYTSSQGGGGGGLLGLIVFVLAGAFVWNVVVPFIGGLFADDKASSSKFVAPPPPPPPSRPKQIRVLPCQVMTTSDSSSDDCSTRDISAHDLYEDIYACNSGPCYAQKFRAIDQADLQPMVIIYPQASGARAEARAQLHAEMIAGVKGMGQAVKDRVNEGYKGVAPSMEEIDNLVNAAIAEIDNIDVPINESPDLQRRRLRIGSSIRILADDVVRDP